MVGNSVRGCIPDCGSKDFPLFSYSLRCFPENSGLVKQKRDRQKNLWLDWKNYVGLSPFKTVYSVHGAEKS